MSMIRGKDFVLFLPRVNASGVFELTPVCYAQNCTIHIEAEMLEATAPPDGGFRNYLPGLRNYTLSFDGVAVENEDGVINIYDLQNFIIENKRIEWKATNTQNNFITYGGFLYLTAVDEGSPFDAMNTFTATAQGDGLINIGVVTPGVLGHIYYGVQDTNANPTDFSNYIDQDPSQDIIIPYGPAGAPKYFWVAYDLNVRKKDVYIDLNDPNNYGTMGDELSPWENRTIDIGGTHNTLAMTRYKTGFTGPNQLVKFFYNIFQPAYCQKAQNLQYNGFTPSGADVHISVSFTDPQYTTAFRYFWRLINQGTGEVTTGTTLPQGAPNVTIQILAKRGFTYTLEISINCNPVYSSGYTQPLIITIPN